MVKNTDKELTHGQVETNTLENIKRRMEVMRQDIMDGEEDGMEPLMSTGQEKEEKENLAKDIGTTLWEEEMVREKENMEEENNVFKESSRLNSTWGGNIVDWFCDSG